MGSSSEAETNLLGRGGRRSLAGLGTPAPTDAVENDTRRSTDRSKLERYVEILANSTVRRRDAEQTAALDDAIDHRVRTVRPPQPARGSPTARQPRLIADGARRLRPVLGAEIDSYAPSSAERPPMKP
jgi:hypothetical protein